MEKQILSALKSIPVSSLSRAEWIAIGMALKEEGFPCSIWDDWSKNDTRYHPGECEKKWNGFRSSASPVKGGTIVRMAKDRGWVPSGNANVELAWDDTIEYDGLDGFNGFSPPNAWNPTQDLITYLETLFDEADRVGYVTGDVWKNEEERWLPSKGLYDRTAGELIQSLKKHPDDIGATIGDWKESAGASRRNSGYRSIRSNPIAADTKRLISQKINAETAKQSYPPVRKQNVFVRTNAGRLGGTKRKSIERSINSLAADAARPSPRREICIRNIAPGSAIFFLDSQTEVTHDTRVVFQDPAT